jgi:hypothetical protein
MYLELKRKKEKKKRLSDRMLTSPIAHRFVDLTRCFVKSKYQIVNADMTGCNFLWFAGGLTFSYFKEQFLSY